MKWIPTRGMQFRYKAIVKELLYDELGLIKFFSWIKRKNSIWIIDQNYLLLASLETNESRDRFLMKEVGQGT